MIGVIEHVRSESEKELRLELELICVLRDAGPSMRRTMKEDGLKRAVGYQGSRAEYIRQLRRCADLSREFREVTRDTDCKRSVRTSGSMVIEIPLIVAAKLPLKPVTKESFYIGRETYQVSAKSPMPTIEALEAARQHGGKFDHLEVWWVPNDVLVEKLPDPDPILVGVVCTKRENHYFELHRWIDEDVELGWWSKEAY